MKPIPYGRQHITEKDIEAVIEVLRSDFLTQGPKISEFEEMFAKYIGSKYAIAVSNGTAALHLSALALGVKAGQKVITSPITFAASANCVRYCGGDVIFCDVDAETVLIDLQQLKSILEKKSKISGIIPVNFAGYPVDLSKLRKIADEYNLWILEDACHSPGGYFIDDNNVKRRCGDGTLADLAIFSFHPVKHIATGEGGMITTNRKDLYEKILLLRTHGITRNSDLLTENHGGWYYEMHDLGFNYRLTDFQAALGISQLTHAEDGLKRRRKIAQRYDDAFLNAPIKIIRPKENFCHAYHLYIIQVKNRLQLYNYLRSNNIFPQVHYIPVHLMPYYKNLGWKKGDFPNAEEYYENCLSLPIYPTLTDEEQEFIIQTVLKFQDNDY
ncbi:MAG: pyridoxal-5'-phosphate-dependent protein [[Candidatus Thermochlorobacteriaceae] bacterium GBChlB]|nr:MAG: pyridoxal-5'-phosphate-dependent protein [[Candidatus Thermochlorobacteriaceae] bacterium GBChlB]